MVCLSLHSKVGTSLHHISVIADDSSFVTDDSKTNKPISCLMKNVFVVMGSPEMFLGTVRLGRWRCCWYILCFLRLFICIIFNLLRNEFRNTISNT